MKRLLALMYHKYKKARITTGDQLFAECLEVCRVHSIEHSASRLSAKRHLRCTWRNEGTQQISHLSSAGIKTLSKE